MSKRLAPFNPIKGLLCIQQERIPFLPLVIRILRTHACLPVSTWLVWGGTRHRNNRGIWRFKDTFEPGSLFILGSEASSCLLKPPLWYFLSLGQVSALLTHRVALAKWHTFSCWDSCVIRERLCCPLVADPLSLSWTCVENGISNRNKVQRFCLYH